MDTRSHRFWCSVDFKLNSSWAICPPNFIRFSTMYRAYKYFFFRRDLDIQVFSSWRYNEISQRMEEASQKLLGEHDFRNFCKIDVVNVNNFNRKILSFSVRPVDESKTTQRYSWNFDEISSNSPDDMCVMTIRGTAFLWHQVRCMAAILFLIGQRLEDPSVIFKLKSSWTS